MAIKNPYGVGDSGVLMRDLVTRCRCCQLEFAFHGHARMTERWPTTCPACADHSDSSDEGRITALAEHNARAIALVDVARNLARDAKAREKVVDDRNRDLSRSLSEVIERRNSLQSKINALRVLHPYSRDTCLCGQWPCAEREVLYDRPDERR